MELIDSHIHLDFSIFDDDRSELMAHATAKGIQQFVVPATTIDSWQSVSKLSRRYPSIQPAYGIHPYFSGSHTLADCGKLEAWIDTHPGIAIGEIGLDHFLTELDQTHQLALFEAQLVISKNHQLPVILHARKAVDIVINALKSHRLTHGIVHSFNGSHVQAMRLIDLGFKLGFGGAITYPRATRLRALIKQLPLDAICLETDAPDQPSLSLKGKRNEPDALLEVLNTISEIRDTEPKIIAEQSKQNTLSALNIC